MRNLTLRIFLSFWLVIGLLIGLAAAGGYAYSERLRQAFQDFDGTDETVVSASAALQQDGRPGLEDWLRELDPVAPIDVYIVDSEGRDLLGRRLPIMVQRLLRRFGRGRGGSDWRRPRWHPEERPNLRLARPITRLLDADGNVYSFFITPKRDPYREWVAARAGPAFLLLALGISGLVSFALAYAIARPVKSFRRATVAIADGEFDTRVSSAMRNRRDEIGLLALDLDAMAAKLKAGAEQQTELTRNVSHELRSPLARLRVALELARRQAGDLPEFARIDKETERLDDLIGQLLSFSRMQSDDGERPAPLSLRTLLEAAVANANYECRSSGIQDVTVKLSDGEDIEFVGHEGALTSALDNVLRNAIHHSPAGGVVTVTLRRLDDEVSVAIEDQGEGVASNELPHLFEPFYRAGTNRKRSGTGLGLAIAERAIAKSGGQIAAEAPDTGGLRVVVTLPLG
ncbi:MAG: ATP-binding protein [Pseudomonadota bacterium]